MVTATEVIGRLAARGITLEADDTGELRIHGISRLSDREKAILRAHKASIFKVLGKTHPPPPAPVASSTVAVVPPARECGNCANFEKYPYEPLGSCHARKRMQHITSKPRKFGCSHFRPAASQQEVRP